FVAQKQELSPMSSSSQFRAVFPCEVGQVKHVGEIRRIHQPASYVLAPITVGVIPSHEQSGDVGLESECVRNMASLPGKVIRRQGYITRVANDINDASVPGVKGFVALQDPRRRHGPELAGRRYIDIRYNAIHISECDRFLGVGYIANQKAGPSVA